MDMTNEEKMALQEKLDNPEKEVICPRCGNRIVYETVGSSEAAKCETKNCLYAAVRGI